MSEDNEKLELGPDKSEDNEKLELGQDKPYKEKFDYEGPSVCPKLPEDSSNYDRYKEEFKNVHDEEEKEKTEKDEPLFVEDRTSQFTLEIEFEDPTACEISKTDTGFKQNACWNCDSVNHSLNNCPKPKNYRLISYNRNVFHLQKNQQQRSGGGNRYRRNPRYFVGDNKLCSNLIVGKLSDQLLEALGLPQNGIPAHVYKMRENGYPRGWLEEAKEDYSGITIFTAPNECLPHPQDDELYCNINVKKLHLYPGFNAPCPPDAIDEYEKYGCPQYDPEQSLSNMVQKLRDHKTDKSLTDSHEDNFEDTGFASSCEDTKTMEEDNSIDKPPSSPEDGEITEDEDYSLDTNNISIEQDVPTLSNETNELVVSEEITHEQNNSEVMESNMDITESINESPSSPANIIITESETPSPTKSLKRKFGDVKSETLGTPVLKHFSTYKNRPNHEKFAKGMVDMIDHENLPHATGTFKKLKELLKDVRKTLSDEL